jgi:Meiotically up-regulated gene 113
MDLDTHPSRLCIGHIKLWMAATARLKEAPDGLERYPDALPYEDKFRAAIASWPEGIQSGQLALIRATLWSRPLLEAYLRVLELLDVPLDALTDENLVELYEIEYWLSRVMERRSFNDAILPLTQEGEEVLRQPSVYFILAEGIDRIKIGYSVDPEGRMSNFISAGNPTPMTLVHTMPGGREDEYRLHQQFAAHRLHGEWFSAQPVLEWLKSLLEGL